MMNSTSSAHHLDAMPTLPQHEGSPESLAVLRAMNDWKAPVSAGELAALTGLSRHHVSHSLQGLRERGRVVCDGNRRTARWLLAHVARAQGFKASLSTNQEGAPC